MEKGSKKEFELSSESKDNQMPISPALIEFHEENTKTRKSSQIHHDLTASNIKVASILFKTKKELKEEAKKKSISLETHVSNSYFKSTITDKLDKDGNTRSVKQLSPVASLEKQTQKQVRWAACNVSQNILFYVNLLCQCWMIGISSYQLYLQNDQILNIISISVFGLCVIGNFLLKLIYFESTNEHPAKARESNNDDVTQVDFADELKIATRQSKKSRKFRVSKVPVHLDISESSARTNKFFGLLCMTNIMGIVYSLCNHHIIPELRFGSVIFFSLMIVTMRGVKLISGNPSQGGCAKICGNPSFSR